MNKKLLIIGGGNMGLAIAGGIVKSKVYRKKDIVFIERNQERISFLKKTNYLVSNKVTKRHKGILGIILAVKPSDISNALVELKNIISSRALIISIAAGIRIKEIASFLFPAQPICRVMPNTPCQIREGMSAITFNKHISKKQKEMVSKMFQALGKTVIMKDEKYFDVVTALSGSGPAYFCLLIECLIKSARKLGLDQEISSSLVLQTAIGTMSMLSKTNISPALLREKVTSKKGTTDAALQVFQKRNFENVVHNALKAGRDRARELSKT